MNRTVLKERKLAATTEHTPPRAVIRCYSVKSSKYSQIVIFGLKSRAIELKIIMH